MVKEWATFSPPFAPHVVGRIEPREWDDVEKKHLPQAVVIRCGHCGEEFRVVCEQGRPREHVMRFGSVHLHNDPLAPAKLVP
jgi:hypothetical protein